MKDRGRKARVSAPSLVAWLVSDGGEDEECTVDMVYAPDADVARNVSWRRGEAGGALKDGQGQWAEPSMLEVSRWHAGDPFARSAPHPKVEGRNFVLRLAGMRWLDERECETCGLSSMGEVEGPYAVCSGCYACGECGHDPGCPDLVPETAGASS